MELPHFFIETRALVFLQPWDDVSTSQDQYGGHAMGESFMEDQTQGVPGWEEAEPAYPANPGPPAQVCLQYHEQVGLKYNTVSWGEVTEKKYPGLT